MFCLVVNAAGLELERLNPDPDSDAHLVYLILIPILASTNFDLRIVVREQQLLKEDTSSSKCTSWFEAAAKP